MTPYEAVADELVRRILVLIPDHPEILDIRDPWELFSVPGFRCDDLLPSAFQAGWALAAAKRAYRAEHAP